MRLITTHRSLRATAALAAGMSLSLAGCAAISAPGDTASQDTRTSQGGSGSALASQLPESIRSKGKVVVAIDPTYPPFETLSADQKTIEGLDPQLLNALAKTLGISVEYSRAGFDTIIPGLQASRYDMAMSAMTDTPERQKQVTFIDYLNVGGAVVMKADDPIRDEPVPGALCGKIVGIQTGTITVGLSDKASKQCLAEGKPKIELMRFPSVPAAVLAISAGRVGYVWTDAVSAAAQVLKGGGSLTQVADDTQPKKVGIVFPSDQQQLIAAFKAALQRAIDDGTYKALLEKHGLADGAVERADVNAGL